MRVALSVELRKAAAARAVRGTAGLLVLGTVALAVSFTLAAASGNEVVLQRLGDAGAGTRWEVLLLAAAQITGAAAVLAHGVVASWTAGREFADGTITGLFATAVPRWAFAVAKATVTLLVGAASSALLVATLLLVGLVLGFGLPEPRDLDALARVGVVGVASAFLALPAALGATLGRGLLAGVAVTVGVVASAQIAVVAGAGAAFPIAAPALWAMRPDVVPPVALLEAVVFGLAAAAVTALAWHRLQLDR